VTAAADDDNGGDGDDDTGSNNGGSTGKQTAGLAAKSIPKSQSTKLCHLSFGLSLPLSPSLLTPTSKYAGARICKAAV
jgi:hypothetical protein